MSFDTTCRRLAEMFPADFARWLLGERISLTELKPTELSLEPIRADSLILLQGKFVIIHIEFQTRPDPEMPKRLADYRLRIHTKFPNKTIHQVVIYLKKTRSKKVFQTTFEIAGMRAEFNVLRIWEYPAKELLNDPGLLPFAVLGKSASAIGTLRSAVQEMQKLPETTHQHETMAAAYVLAGLKLEKDLISRVIRRDIMRESVTYQAILEEGEQIGIEQGIEQGVRRTQSDIARRLLASGMAVQDVVRFTDLTHEQVRALQREL